MCPSPWKPCQTTVVFLCYSHLTLYLDTSPRATTAPHEEPRFPTAATVLRRFVRWLRWISLSVLLLQRLCYTMLLLLLLSPGLVMPNSLARCNYLKYPSSAECSMPYISEHRAVVHFNGAVQSLFLPSLPIAPNHCQASLSPAAPAYHPYLGNRM